MGILAASEADIVACPDFRVTHRVEVICEECCHVLSDDGCLGSVLVMDLECEFQWPMLEFCRGTA
jgi:hypothetical protein